MVGLKIKPGQFTENVKTTPKKTVVVLFVKYLRVCMKYFLFKFATVALGFWQTQANRKSQITIIGQLNEIEAGNY